MTESSSTNMICPKCGQFQEKADTCNACGIVIAKVRGEQTVTQTDSGSTAAEAVQPVNNPGYEATAIQTQGPYQKLIFPLIIIGIILIGVGAGMLINKLSGGSLNQGTMRHLGWFFIPLFIMTGIGCIAQAFEWKKQ